MRALVQTPHRAPLRRTPLTVTVALAVVVGLSAACEKPGLVGEGRAEGVWQGEIEEAWVGTCRYERTTRWASNLPHVLKLSEEETDRSLTIQSNRAFTTGSFPLPSDGRRAMQGLALDGATVTGSLHGSLDVSQAGDSMVFTIRGVRTHRDSVAFEARCLLESTRR